MSENMELTDGVDTVSFSPLVEPAYRRPDNRDRGHFEASDGTRWWWDGGGKRQDEPALDNISKADADQLNAWWEAITELTYYPDKINAPSTTKTVIISNETEPLQMNFDTGWEQKYRGTLILNEMSSSTSSSSSSSSSSSG
jgi:hypothetical protein